MFRKLLLFVFLALTTAVPFGFTHAKDGVPLPDAQMDYGLNLHAPQAESEFQELKGKGPRPRSNRPAKPKKDTKPPGKKGAKKPKLKRDAKAPGKKVGKKPHSAIPKAPGKKRGLGAAAKQWSKGKPGHRLQNVYGHWKKHRKEFPEYKNAKQYANGAISFVRSPPPGTQAVARRVNGRRNGETMYYNRKSNTFAVVNANGKVKTMYRPTDGKKFWKNELKRWGY